MAYGIHDLIEEAARAAIRQTIHPEIMGEEADRLAQAGAKAVLESDDLAVVEQKDDDLKTIAKAVGMAVATGKRLLAEPRSYVGMTEGRYDGAV